MTTLLLHVSGQWIKSDVMTMPVTKRDAQGFGSALSYARRYSLLALAGVTGDDDDDGNGAVAQPARKPVPATAREAAVKGDPRTGQDFLFWIEDSDAKALAAGWIDRANDLSAHVQTRAAREGWPESCLHWTVEQVTAAVGWARTYAQDQRSLRKKAKQKNPEPVGV